MESNQTSGVNIGGFVPIETYKNKSTDQIPSTEGLEEHVNYTMKILPTVVKTLEEHFPFVASIVSLVGYIVISAFGHMDSLGKYIGYTLFLLFVYFLYRLSQLKNKTEFNFSKTNVFFIFGFIVLLIVFIIQNVNIFLSLLSQSLSFFKQTKK